MKRIRKTDVQRSGLGLGLGLGLVIDLGLGVCLGLSVGIGVVDETNAKKCSTVCV